MKSQKNSKTKYLDLIDWFGAGRDNSAGPRVALPPRVKRFNDYLWPAGMKYESSLNPIFLSECISLAEMNRRPVWLIRDGLVPVLWFFHTHPKPDGFKSRLLVHEEFAPFVPDRWRPYVGSYRLESVRQDLPRKTESILLVGIVSDYYSTVEGLDGLLGKLVSHFGLARLRRMAKFAFLSVRENPSGTDHRHVHHADFFIRLCRRLGANIEPLTWAQFEAQDLFKESMVIDLNDRILCADNYLVHHALGGGAVLPVLDVGKGKRSSEKDEVLFPLSNHHAFRVRYEIDGRFLNGDLKQKRLSIETQQFLRRMDAAMLSGANQSFPWPEWFLGWGRSFASGASGGVV